MWTTTAPFTRDTQLDTSLDDLSMFSEKNKQPVSSTRLNTISLPGHPRMKLNDADRLTSFLVKETCTPDLETMAPYLWMMSTQSSANVSPLHHQHVKGREFIIAEDPRLHLVWIYNRIFIKPMPRYLLSHAFWEMYLLDPNSPLGIHRKMILKSALGYLRTWTYLITHESDFIMAQDSKLRLIPQHVSWEDFSAFLEQLSSISDGEVSQRYAFGELRLTRLNFYIKFIMHKRHYMKVHGQYGAYFARFYAPILFTFSVLSIILNAMQVGMSVESVIVDQWLWFWQVCRWVSVLAILMITLLSVALGLLLLSMIADEWIFAIKVKRRKRREGHIGP